MSARARIHAMLTLDDTTAHELDSRLDALIAEELRAAADDCGSLVQAGGSRARGLAYARTLLITRANGSESTPPHRSVRHPEVAESLRARPGEWGMVGDYANSSSAAGIAWQIRHGRASVAYQPSGSFEARFEPTPDGSRVFARYVGDGVQADPFFQPGRTYTDGTGYSAPEITVYFRVEHVTRHPDRGHLRAIGWSRTGAPDAGWHGDFRDEGEFDGWTEVTEGGDAG